MPSPVIDSSEQDQALLVRFREGDRGAFATLVNRYQKPIFNAAYRVLGNAHDASDITQEVFLKILERLDGYDVRYKFFSWIYRIAINESIDLLRRTGREDPLDEDAEFAAPESDGPESALESSQLGRRVQRALMGMKMDDRVILTLRHFSECSYRDIAEVLAIDEKTVKSRLFEARQRLAEQLKDLREVRP